MTFNPLPPQKQDASTAATAAHDIEYLKRMDAARWTGRNRTEESLYAFERKFLDTADPLRADFDATPALFGADFAELNPRPQFYLGPAGSGAPLHWHVDAVNLLAHGRKRWFLAPPAAAAFSTAPAGAWFDNLVNSPPADASAAPFECVQEAGDALYVPTNWGHATLNVEESIGIAHEFHVHGYSVAGEKTGLPACRSASGRAVAPGRARGGGNGGSV